VNSWLIVKHAMTYIIPYLWNVFRELTETFLGHFLDMYIAGDLSPTLMSESDEDVAEVNSPVVRVVGTSFPEMYVLLLAFTTSSFCAGFVTWWCWCVYSVVQSPEHVVLFVMAPWYVSTSAAITS
jgi:hypothetical protein